VKKDEMGRGWSKHLENRKACKILVGNPEEKRH
jgi:hypothetical protein